MSTLTINKAVKPTLPTQTYCFRGRWDCEDSVHNCPGMCGYVRYKDEYGNILEEYGFCITDTNIQMEVFNQGSSIALTSYSRNHTNAKC